MEQKEKYTVINDQREVTVHPEELLYDVAEKRPGTFILAAAAVSLGVIGLIGYSISKGRKLKIDLKKLDISLD